jgi:hypothetical protein
MEKRDVGERSGTLERFSYRMRLWHRVSAMPEVAVRVLRADRAERILGRLEKRLQDSRLGPPTAAVLIVEPPYGSRNA